MHALRPPLAVASRLALVVVLCCTRGALAAPLDEPIRPVPLTLGQVPARVEIGRQLFGDVRLSVNLRVSCASCHDIRRGGAETRPRSIGFNGDVIAINAPTVLNAALNFKQFWDGRADTLEAQIDSVVTSPQEMGSSWDDVVERISHDRGYARAFAAAYKDGVTRANIRNAIASYERTLITPNSRFDKFLRGDATAISPEEKAGYAAFKKYGCIACHQGVNVGGNMFQKLGIMDDYFAKRGNIRPSDLGRYAVTGNDADKYVFKVPSLRNVALTAPYFHDGSARTLRDAVEVMFHFQLGRPASAADKDSIILFLNTLTGELTTQP